MNNSNRKLLGLTVAVVLAAGSMSFGTNTGTIDVKARVLSPITVSGEKDLDFGDVLQDDASTILPGSGDAGRFDVSGVTTGGTTVELTFDAPANLGDAGLTFAGSYSWGTVQGTPAGTTTSGTAQYVSPPAAFSVWIGGTLTIGASVPPGSYTEEFTLTVDYVN